MTTNRRQITDDELYSMEYARLHELYTELTGETADDLISDSELMFKVRAVLGR